MAPTVTTPDNAESSSDSRWRLLAGVGLIMIGCLELAIYGLVVGVLAIMMTIGGDNELRWQAAIGFSILLVPACAVIAGVGVLMRRRWGTYLGAFSQVVAGAYSAHTAYSAITNPSYAAGDQPIALAAGIAAVILLSTLALAGLPERGGSES